MTTLSQRPKTITTKKIPATNNKVLARTGSLHFFKKYWQPIEKLWSLPVPVRETIQNFKQNTCGLKKSVGAKDFNFVYPKP